MYTEHFGLDRPPFRITPDTRLFYTGGRRGDVLEALVYAITSGEGIVKVVGEVGTGKTMLCRMLEEKLPGNVQIAYLANPSLTPEDILHAVALELGLDPPAGASRLQVMHRLHEVLLERHAANQRVVALVEEAQSMPVDTLEEIRLLSNLETKNEKLLQIVLFGQPELDANLARGAIRQLRERITHSFQLTPLARDEIRDYVGFRLRASGYRGRDVFTAGAYRLIARASQGLTRRVNVIADKAMLAAFAEGSHEVSSRHVRHAVRDSEFDAGRRRAGAARAKGALAAGAAALALLAGAVGWYAGRSAPPQRAAQASAVVAPGADARAASRPAATEPVAAASAPAALDPGAAAGSGEPAPAPSSGTPAADLASVAARAGKVAAAAVRTAHVPAPPAPAAGAGQSPARTADEDAAAAAPPAPLAVASAAAPAAAAAREPAPAPAAVSAVAAATADRGPAPPAAIAVDAGGAGRPAGPQPVPVAQAPAEPEDPSPTFVPLARSLDAPGGAARVSGSAAVPAPERPPADAAAARGASAGEANASPAAAPAASAVSASAAGAASPRDADAARDGAGERGAEPGSMLSQRLAITRDWLRGVNDSHYSIQLLATDAAQQRNLEHFLRRRSSAGQIREVYVYRTLIRGRPWYGVLYGEFESFSEARDALDGLPADLRRHEPFIRNIRDIAFLG